MGEPGITHSLSQSTTQSMTQDSAFIKDITKDQTQITSKELTAEVTQMATAQDAAKATEEAAAKQLAEIVKGAQKGAESKKTKDGKPANAANTVKEASAATEKEGEVAKDRVDPKFKEVADAFEKKTAKEISAQTVMSIKNAIRDNTSPDDAIKLVESLLKEVGFSHEVLEFLKDNTEGAQKKVFEEAFNKYDAENGDRAKKERAVSVVAREMSKDGSGEVVSLREEVNGFIREDMSPNEIFKELRVKYGKYNIVRDKIGVVLDYIGKALKDPGIEGPHLIAMNTGVRKLQAVKNVYVEMKMGWQRIERNAANIEEMSEPPSGVK